MLLLFYACCPTLVAIHFPLQNTVIKSVMNSPFATNVTLEALVAFTVQIMMLLTSLPVSENIFLQSPFTNRNN